MFEYLFHLVLFSRHPFTIFTFTKFTITFLLMMITITGAPHLRLEEEEPRAWEVQVCARLQDQGIEETDWTKRKGHQEHERADSGGMS